MFRCELVSMISIVVNGKEREVRAGLSLEELLGELELDPRAVAVEYNRRIVKREAYAETPVEEGDRLEIVRFVQGG